MKAPLSETEQLIYQAYLQKGGKAAADGWLKAYLPTKPTFHTSDSKSVEVSGWLGDARAKEDFKRRALAELLERSKNRDVYGQEAIDLAAALIGVLAAALRLRL